MSVEPRDYHLSMRLSRRARNAVDNKGLRSLIIHRLRDTAKAALRISIKQDIAAADRAEAYSVYCEPCGDWFKLPEWGEEVHHQKCGRIYVLEFAIFSEVEGEVKG